MVLVLAIISLVFSWRQIYEISKEYMRYKRKVATEENANEVNRSDLSASKLG